MLVILHKSSRLLKVIAFEMVLQHLAEFVDHWNLVFTDDDALHVIGLDLLVPFVVPQRAYRNTLLGVCVQNSFD